MYLKFLKSEYKDTGVMGDVLEHLYREKYQENLPDNWVQLLEVYSYFTFDKLVVNKIIIYLVICFHFNYYYCMYYGVCNIYFIFRMKRIIIIKMVMAI